MDTHPPPPPLLLPITSSNGHSTVDTSRPFRSVKEAVELFGERFLVNEVYSTPRKMFSLPPFPLPRSSSSTSSNHVRDNELGLADILKKLEVELEHTKRELNVLKEKEMETQIALASLHAELHKNMSKMAKVEADVAGKAASSRALVVYGKESEIQEEKIEYSSTLADLLSIREDEEKQRRKMMKKKPIVPLLGDMLSKKKGSSRPLYHKSSSHMCFK